MAAQNKQQRLKGLSKRAESVEVMKRLRRDAKLIANHFGLTIKAIEAEKSGVVGHYGVCYHDGLIRVRLRHARSGKLLRYSSLVNTLCHELAHLRYFDHGEGFKRLYFEILRWARARGIYVPNGERAAREAKPSLSAAELRKIAEQTLSNRQRIRIAPKPDQLGLFES